MRYRVAGYLLALAGSGVITYVSIVFGLPTLAIVGLVGGVILTSIGSVFLSVARDRSNYLSQLEDVAKTLEKENKS